MAKKYSKKEVRNILITAYPHKSEDEIEAMVEETMAQYLAEAKGQDENEK